MSSLVGYNFQKRIDRLQLGTDEVAKKEKENVETSSVKFFPVALVPEGKYLDPSEKPPLTVPHPL